MIFVENIHPFFRDDSMTTSSFIGIRRSRFNRSRKNVAANDEKSIDALWVAELSFSIERRLLSSVLPCR